MFGFLLSHFLISGLGLAAILAFVGFGLLGGWPLVLNRRVIGALVLVLAAVGALLWWEHKKESLRAEGAKECVAENVEARVERVEVIKDYTQDLSDAIKEGQERAMMAQDRINRALEERKSHVSKAADAACPIPRGFVRDHDSDLPSPAGRPRLPSPQTDDDVPTGLVLSRVGTVVAHNYGECGKVVADESGANETRYAACVAWDARFKTQSGCSR